MKSFLVDDILNESSTVSNDNTSTLTINNDNHNNINNDLSDISKVTSSKTSSLNSIVHHRHHNHHHHHHRVHHSNQHQHPQHQISESPISVPRLLAGLEMDCTVAFHHHHPYSIYGASGPSPPQHNHTHHSPQSLSSSTSSSCYNPSSSSSTTLSSSSLSSVMSSHQVPYTYVPGPHAFQYTWITPPRQMARKRTVFSGLQRQELEETFQKQRYISKPERIQLAERIGLNDSQVKIWFINRRTKWRNDREHRRTETKLTTK